MPPRTPATPEPATTRKTKKKVAAKKATKEVAAKRKVVATKRAKKVAAKKVAAKPAAAKKVAAKKVAAKKVAAKKVAAKKEPVATTTAKKELVAAPQYRPRNGAPPTAEHVAPTKWTFWPNKAQTLGVWVHGELIWIGNDAGEVYGLTRDGVAEHAFKLPRGVRCLSADDAWRYAGSADGKVYDLTGRTPRVAYVVSEGVDLLWMDVCRGRLTVADDAGAVTAFDFEGERLWRAEVKGASKGWMVRADGAGVYHGHSKGVTAYDWEGAETWAQETAGVGFGWQTTDTVFASTNDAKVLAFSKATGAPAGVYQLDRLKASHLPGAPSCAVTPDGERIFAADCAAAIYCFARDGTRLWKLGTNCGTAGSMWYQDGILYLVTWDGATSAVDVSDEAVAAALRGEQTTAKASKKAPAFVTTEAAAKVEATKEVGAGVLVECVREGSKLRVRVLSDGYDASWNCQFPRDIRVEGARYVVESVREAEGGGFYRALGEIRRLV